MEFYEELYEIIPKTWVDYCPRVKGRCEITVMYTKKENRKQIGKLFFECGGKDDCPYYRI